MGDIVEQLDRIGCLADIDGDCTCCIAQTAIGEIERLRTERDTAFLAGVKAGLDAAKKAFGVDTDERWAIDLIDPAKIAATIKPTSAGEGGDGPSADGAGVV